MFKYEPRLKHFARDLRCQQTVAELKLWQRLRRKQLHGIQFFRQRPIGRYIVDFVAIKPQLIIELDGSQHFHGEVVRYDLQRDTYLRRLGFAVLRFNNRQVLWQTSRVMETIYLWMENHLAGRENPPASSARDPL